MGQRHELTLPDLGLGETPVTVSVWLVEPSTEVSAGDRVLEILAGSATVDLPAPMGGVLIEQLVEEGDVLQTGQVLGIIQEL